jgi:hypothetical protein
VVYEISHSSALASCSSCFAAAAGSAQTGYGVSLKILAALSTKTAVSVMHPGDRSARTAISVKSKIRKEGIVDE